MKKNSFYAFNRAFVIAVLLLSSFTFAYAQTFIGGGGDDLWSNVNNWADGIKPTEESENVAIHANVIIDEDVTVVSLFDAVACDLTIQSGKKLTAVGELVWDKGGDFVVEDGAQLITDSQVTGTVQKKIVAYDDEVKMWDIIASPVIENVMPSLENGFLTDPASGYALMAFNEQNHSWIDFKESAFPIVSGKGYLYANALDTTLLLTGTLTGSGAPVEVNLDYHSSNGTLAGCNLVGNPLPCNAYTDRSYYLLNDAGTTLLPVMASSAMPVAPCTGMFVKADGVGETVAFSRVSPQTTHNRGSIEITVVKPDAPNVVLDQILVSFNEDDNLGKLAYNPDNPNLYFTEGTRTLAIISVDSADVVPFRFKAVENGSFMLKVTPRDLDISFLHLSDNASGANIDLLDQPEYTFAALTSDYASRFKLILDPHYGIEEDGPSTGSGAFAYYANGEIIINDVETCHGASLQIIDMMGRVVVTHVGDAINRVSTIGLAKGVYVLRLNTIHGVRTQKMVIE